MISSTVLPAGPVVIDLAYLESSSFGDDDFVLQAIELMLDELPEHVRELNDAWIAGDWPLVRLTAHKIKSSAALLGMEPAKQTLASIELSAFAPDDLDDIERSIQEVSADCGSALEALRIERYKYL